MTYQETLDFLFSIEKFGMKLGLERIRACMDALGNPQDRYPIVHVAGTNGKGSTAAMIQSIMTSAGYKVGLLTSPHLVDFAERARIGYQNCEQEFIVDFVERNRELMTKIPISYFEITTALGFEYFAQKGVDIGVIEVGMGGRLDATNVVNPEVCIITNIGYEHTKSLGNTLELIAAEKGGIIKPGTTCISASREDSVVKTIRGICESRHADFISIHDHSHWSVVSADITGSTINACINGKDYENVFVNLPGRHQAENAVTALTAVRKLADNGFEISKAAVLEGLRSIQWKGRLQTISRKPLVVADAAHNSAGMRTLRAAIREFLPDKRIIVVLGVLSEKDYVSMLEDIEQFADYLIIAKPDSTRAADPELLAQKAREMSIECQVIPSVQEAYRKARSMAGENDLILVAGSLYTVGEVLAAGEKRLHR